jgi:hypothetical protein
MRSKHSVDAPGLPAGRGLLNPTAALQINHRNTGINKNI